MSRTRCFEIYRYQVCCLYRSFTNILLIPNNIQFLLQLTHSRDSTGYKVNQEESEKYNNYKLQNKLKTKLNVKLNISTMQTL